jgi:hypothetical protein
MYHDWHLAHDDNGRTLLGMNTSNRAHIQLRKRDRRQLTAMLAKGRESARVLRRAMILRQLDEG